MLKYLAASFLLYKRKIILFKKLKKNKQIKIKYIIRYIKIKREFLLLKVNKKERMFL